MSFRVKIPSVNSFEELNEYLFDLERRIQDAFLVGEFETINISEINVAPDKPRDGDIINADGSDFNPGSGKGLYFYGTSYNKL